MTATDALAPAPLLVEGDGLARGAAQGEELRERVRESVGRFVDSAGGPRQVTRFLRETSFEPAILRHTPELFAEVDGIAAGSDVERDHVLAYNLMDEHWWWSQPSHVREACSLLGVPAVPGLLGQTMDLPTDMDGSAVMVRHRTADGHSTAVLTSAGLVGLCGASSAGVGVCVNTLSSLNHRADGLPVAFVVRGALAQPDGPTAIDFVRSVPHASGQHYAVMARRTDGPARGASLEASAGGVVDAADGEHWFGHANHPLASTDLVAKGDPEPGTTHERQHVLDSRGGQVRTLEDLTELLGERTAPICVARGGDRGWFTFGAIAVELGAVVRMRYTLGPPGEQPWGQLEL